MSDSSPRARVSRRLGRTAAGAALLVATTAALTAWVMSATAGERVVRGRALPPPVLDAADPVVVPVIVPVVRYQEEPETVEVLVASKDLPVGTLLRAEDKPWVTKYTTRSAAPAAHVSDPADLTGHRLTRALRKGDAFDPKELTKAAVPALPGGHDMASLALAPADAAGGFAVPGSRVDVVATMRDGEKVRAFTLLSDVLVVAVDAEGAGGKKPQTVAVAFAVAEKQVRALSLAKARGCHLALVLRNPDKGADKGYDIDAVVKLLSAPEVAPAPRLK